jgi:dihydrodipicolinate reductase
VKVVVIDGQSGRMGQLFVERVKAAAMPCEVLAVGTNAIATSAMLKAGADAGATGENPVLVACRTADVIVGPIGILSADSLLGEITPAIAVAIGQSSAKKLLLPVNQCNNIVVGTQSLTLSQLMDAAVDLLRQVIEKDCSKC